MDSLKTWIGENKMLTFFVVATLILFIIVVGGGAGIIGKSTAKLDNRPRWMMGGLRDDTGSHNAKDVFGMGFGLD